MFPEFLCHTYTGVGNHEFGFHRIPFQPLGRCKADRTTLKRILRRISNDIHKHLGNPRLIAHDSGCLKVLLHHKPNAAVLNIAPLHGLQTIHDFGNANGRFLQIDPSGLQLADIQNVTNQGKEIIRCRFRLIKPVQCLLSRSALPDVPAGQMNQSKHTIQRRANLMGHI